MQNALAGIAKIKGVKGFSVFDTRGACVVHQMPPPYEAVLMNQVLEQLRAAFDAVRCLDESGMDSFIGRFSQGCVVLKPLANHTVMIVAEPDLNLATLGIGLKVASLKLGAAESGRISGPMDTVAASAQKLALHANSSSNLSQGIALNESRIPADAVSAAVMSELTQLLAVRIGPMAKVTLKGTLTSLGLHPRAVGPPQFDELVALVARKIPDVAARQPFINAARALLRSR
jgi:hypothetical protein